ncbi:oxaloacetate decarboxylase [Bradyrhizobium sp. BTAi1]|jgi:2-methylisocitrate lyase-like PEP mutase family enzyme|uniref:isocitrate lyase/PEP mutase family protein n=1 Tax=Bradyrhizobium sp. (strain BTAi1 / ATCC BAA-1182) TaxID=288000 RepID=UPI00005DFC0B|nr:isocitrate lyase/phosphoenolpyruvate mutase family protein [Bradyrhizobium sp. BTAi1]ABQ37020.1 putative methylisocitrate lyase or carboxyvinyl-carboxyphosphonate phosphorylmutase [Bradyrhizobium sp. BTAi1]
MAVTTADKRAAFRRLHQAGCFMLPNPFDIGTAKMLQQLGFQAIASTSAGFAWSIGKPDTGVELEEMLAHLTSLSAAVDIPVNADFEGGFADAPDGVAANVTRAVATGIAGLSIEDSTGDASHPLYERALAVERIRAARQAIDATGADVLLTGRCEAYLWGRKDLALVIDRLCAYAEAGADCLYAPGITTPEDVAEIVKAVGPKPINLLNGGGAFSLQQAEALGVRRISIGGALARMAWAGVMRAAKDMAEQGSFAVLADRYTGDLDAMFKA